MWHNCSPKMTRMTRRIFFLPATTVLQDHQGILLLRPFPCQGPPLLSPMAWMRAPLLQLWKRRQYLVLLRDAVFGCLSPTKLFESLPRLVLRGLCASYNQVNDSRGLLLKPLRSKPWVSLVMACLRSLRVDGPTKFRSPSNPRIHTCKFRV